VKLKLKEDPREWRKFGWVLSVFIALLTALWMRKHPGLTVASTLGLGASLGIALLATAQPKAMRPVYRASMTFSAVMGGFTGKILLALVYGLALLPIALILRALGKDLLNRKHAPNQPSYWSTPPRPSPLDRLF